VLFRSSVESFAKLLPHTGGDTESAIMGNNW
jgi:hypothetical protein